MPEMRFVVRWPDGRREACYSPSLIIRDYLREGESYALADFLARSREALQIASDRVQAKYGRACSLALSQLNRIEATAARFADEAAAKVVCESFITGDTLMDAEPRFERHYGAVVVGGGQAGLSASYCLSRAGVDHVVFEKKTAMHKWRHERWDKFLSGDPELAVPAARARL